MFLYNHLPDIFCSIFNLKFSGGSPSIFRHNPAREIQMLKLCQGHPNIVKLVDVFTDHLHIYIVMELMKGGELLERLQRRHSFTEQQACLIIKQLVSAVERGPQGPQT